MMTMTMLASAVIAFAISIMFLGMFLKYVISTIPQVTTINHRMA